ncbi:hypothetical protein BX616_011318 [Lobosporangium transversale]|uniref:Uncharacterized protein n=1 Tax=Lobosporangium transversale TaxID=64571 RepID=A0A1Y2GTP5_9FUNG|nr:hypothetical protein BCR41DRAFT_421195 [Lobosporangium transversale]KAF9917784.1 hypothetical protein BX616_011318 [Lobosporangium transversale]ORZ20100.1 hypothetical protein BCR41DRAFT_421195 [Lobosporangium transversale]|eukprot:XP_021882640.1 hypothetical protein BCR41DRAFT_421195 [Lobosporangium transversale]
MNSTASSPESCLSIDRVFDKIHSSDYKAALANSAKRKRVLSFYGQITHMVSATKMGHTTMTNNSTPCTAIDLDTFPSTHALDVIISEKRYASTASSSSGQLLEVLQDSRPYSLHKDAIKIFQKMWNGETPDHIIWLKQLQEQSISETARECSRIENEQQAEIAEKMTKSGINMIQLSDDESTTISKGTTASNSEEEIDSPENDGKESVTHRSDPGHGYYSIDRANVFQSKHEGENHSIPRMPQKIVAVLLNNCLVDTQNQNNTLSGESSTSALLTLGSVMEVTRAVMLWEEISKEEGAKVSFLGIAGKTKVRAMPLSPSLMKKRSINKGVMQGSKILNKADQFTIHHQVRLHHEPERPGKRKRARSPVFFSDEKGIDVPESSLPVQSRPPKTKPVISEMSETLKVSKLMTFKQQRDRPRAISPLDLFVRRRADYSPQSDSFDDGIIFLSDLWSSLPFSNMTTDASTYSNDESIKVPNLDITRHICWLTRIHTIIIRAICNECNNDYKGMSCIFGCLSRKWRLHTHMECSITDGTAEAKLVLSADQEDILWTLLGLKKRSDAGAVDKGSNEAMDRAGSGNIVDRNLGLDTMFSSRSTNFGKSCFHESQQETINKVLQSLARRGKLLYKAPAASCFNRNVKSSDHNEGIEHVTKIDQYQTPQELAEEQVWLDICTAVWRRCERFILHAQIVSTAPSTDITISAKASTTVTKNVPLKISMTRINHQKTIQTLVRPPLVLRAIYVKWITPRTEANVLLGQLIHSSQ